MEVTEWDERLVLDDPVGAELVALAGLPAGTRCRDLGGSWTTNVLAEPPEGEPLVVRVHQRTTSVARLRAEQAVRVALADADVPTVRPLPRFTSDAFGGDTIGRLAAGQLVEAETDVAWETRMDTPERLVTGFGLLARVHDVLRTADLPAAARRVRFANHLSGEEGLAASRVGAERVRGWGDPELTAFADDALAQLAEVRRLELLIAPEAPHRQLVHGDWWDNNVLFAGDSVTAVLDVGFMAQRPRIDDLALPIWFFLLRDDPDPARDLDTVAAMLEAYDARAEIPLTPVERRLLPLVVARQLAWSLGRWIVELPEDEAVAHARDAATEFPAARQVFADLDRWQAALS